MPNTTVTGISPLIAKLYQLFVRSLPCSFLITFALATPAVAATITDLGTLGGTQSDASGINAAGQVVGTASIAGDKAQHAFLYSGGRMTDLGISGHAAGINSSGQVVGVSGILAFLYSGGTTTSLGTFGNQANFSSYAAGINDAGQVAGSSDLVDANGRTEHAFLYAGGVLKDLGTFGGTSSRGYGINAAGQVVGDSDLTGFTPSHAFLYAGGRMTDLGTLAGAAASSSAFSINASGQIVGNSDVAAKNVQHAFLYSGGVMKDLGTLGGVNSYAKSINAGGQIAGQSNIAANAFSAHAFLYAGGIMTDLNSQLPAGSGWVLEDATGINDSGQIVGTGTISGQRHAYLLNGVTAPQTQSQTITFGPLSTVSFGVAPFSIAATASSALTVSFASTTSAVCTVAGTTVTIVAAGTCSLTASQAGNAGFTPATPVTQAFIVGKASQTITFATPGNVVVGAAPVTIAATASSGLPVSLSSSTATGSGLAVRFAATTAVCSVSGSSATIVAAGICSITATQTGNANYLGAAPVTQSFTVNAAGSTAQTITFGPLPEVAFGAAPVTLTATASSGLAVTFSSSPAAVCTISGKIVTFIGGGACSITATQPGNASIGAATPVTQNFNVKAAANGPTITQNSIGPASSSATTIQPGSWITFYGSNLAAAAATAKGDFPTSLGGVSVTINGQKAYLSYVSPSQINMQAPDDTTTGKVSVTITNGNGSFTSTVTLAPFGPSFALLDGKHVAAIILRSDGSGAYGGGTYDIIGPTGTSLGYKTVAAKQGDIVELFGVGFGPTNPAVPAGQLFSGAAATTNPVQLTIGATTVTSIFTGVSGAGLYQINVVIPAGLGTGDQSLLGIVSGNATQATVVISLQ